MVSATTSAIFVSSTWTRTQNSSPPNRYARPPSGSPRWSRSPEAGEQGIARRMTEPVVVRLEAVQVEQHQHGLRSGVDRLVEVADERAPVPETGQQVCLRLVPSVFKEAQVVHERHAHAHEHGGERERRECDPERVQRLEVVDDLEHEGDRAEERRHEDEANAVELRGADPPRRQRACARDQQDAGRPAEVEPRPTT